MLIDAEYVEEQLQFFKDLWAVFNSNIVWHRSLQVFQGQISIQLEFSVPGREIALARWYPEFCDANIVYPNSSDRPTILSYTVQFGNSFPSIDDITVIESRETSIHYRPVQ